MKIKTLLLSMIITLPALAQKAFTIKGQVGHDTVSAKVYFYYEDDGGVAHVDSAKTQNGAFEFKGNIDKPAKGVLWLAHKPIKFRQFQNFYLGFLKSVKNEQDAKNWGNDVLSLFVYPGTTIVKSEETLYTSVVSGNRPNEELSALKHLKLDDTKQKMQLLTGVNNMAGKHLLTKELVAKTDSFYNILLETDRQIDFAFLKTHTNSIVSLDILNLYLDQTSDVNIIGNLFTLLAPELRETPEAKKLQQKISVYKNLELGALAPGFSQTDTAGHPVDLKLFRGRYVLIDFWASWYGPCRSENPNVVKAFETFNKRKFTVLGISLDKPGERDKWLQAIQKDHLQGWPQLSDLKGGNNAVALLYHITAIPQNILVNPDGVIIAKNLRGKELTEKLDQLLK